MTPRILVVDDDRSMVRTLCDIFRLRGWNPGGVYSGEEAVEAQQAENYQIVLMDIKMPGMDGVAAFRRMQQHSPGVKVVLMTAHAGEDLISDAEQAGALQVMPKPLNLASLMTLLDGVKEQGH